jgi:hypothetical protein
VSRPLAAPPSVVLPGRLLLLVRLRSGRSGADSERRRSTLDLLGTLASLRLLSTFVASGCPFVARMRPRVLTACLPASALPFVGRPTDRFVRTSPFDPLSGRPSLSSSLVLWLPRLLTSPLLRPVLWSKLSGAPSLLAVLAPGLVPAHLHAPMELLAVSADVPTGTRRALARLRTGVVLVP